MLKKNIINLKKEQGGEEAGAEQEDLPVGGQDASEAGEMMPEEDPEDDDVVDCEEEADC